MKYQKTNEDFQKHLATQIKFIEASSKSYDAGFEDEAQRLATTLRVLFHDSSKDSISLLSHLKVKNIIYLLSSVYQYVPANLASYLGFLTLSHTIGKAISPEERSCHRLMPSEIHSKS